MGLVVAALVALLAAVARPAGPQVLTYPHVRSEPPLKPYAAG